MSTAGRPKRRTFADHNAAAEAARSCPGEWAKAGFYPALYVARAVANVVSGTSHKHIVAYLPLRSFEADVRLTDDGAEVWVRYVEDHVADGRLVCADTEDDHELLHVQAVSAP